MHDCTDESLPENIVKRGQLYIPKIERDLQAATQAPKNSLIMSNMENTVETFSEMMDDKVDDISKMMDDKVDTISKMMENKVDSKIGKQVGNNNKVMDTKSNIISKTMDSKVDNKMD